MPRGTPPFMPSLTGLPDVSDTTASSDALPLPPPAMKTTVSPSSRTLGDAVDAVESTVRTRRGAPPAAGISQSPLHDATTISLGERQARPLMPVGKVPIVTLGPPSDDTFLSTLLAS